MGVSGDIQVLFARFDVLYGLLGCYCVEQYWFQRDEGIAILVKRLGS